MKKLIATTVMFVVFTALAIGQIPNQTIKGSIKDKVHDYNFSVSTTYLTFLNFGPEQTNTHMCEFHIGYKITPNDKIGIKVASWQLFEPMAMGQFHFLGSNHF